MTRMGKSARAMVGAMAVATLALWAMTTTPALANVSKAVTATPIKHLVVVFQENVSFDHYFGTYPNATYPRPVQPGTAAVTSSPTIPMRSMPASSPPAPRSPIHSTRPTTDRAISRRATPRATAGASGPTAANRARDLLTLTEASSRAQ